MGFVVALRPGLVPNGWQTPVASLVSWTLGKQDPHSTTKKNNSPGSNNSGKNWPTIDECSGRWGSELKTQHASTHKLDE